MNLDILEDCLTIFCKYHAQTTENPYGTECTTHLDTGRCFKCPYTLKDIQYREVFGAEPEIYISSNKDKLMPWKGRCADFEPLNNPSIISLIKRLKI